MLRSGMNNQTLLSMFSSGLQHPVQVRFHGLRDKKTFSARVGMQLSLDSAQLFDYLSNDSVALRYGFSPEAFSLLFIPNTYEMYWTTSVEEFTARMHKEYARFWDKENRRAKADSLGLTPQEVGILASIVQAETTYVSEMPRIAGVYLNRLARNIALYADPTLIYAWKDFGIRRVLDKHKDIDSPYNTYRYKGLPPGPIGFPEIQSILAVLDAETHNYLYFCARDDFSGRHVFSRTLSAHNKQARRYQRALNRSGIYR